MFYAKVVDQDNKGVPGALIMARVNRFNENWASTGSPANRDASYGVAVRSDQKGNAILNGYSEGIYYIRVSCPDYDWLYDKDVSQGETLMGNFTVFDLTPGGHPFYIPNPQQPAVYVLVKHGETEVHACPSPGGNLSPRHIGGPNVPLWPEWPREPSLPNVRFVKNVPRSAAAQK